MGAPLEADAAKPASPPPKIATFCLSIYVRLLKADDRGASITEEVVESAVECNWKDLPDVLVDDLIDPPDLGHRHINDIEGLESNIRGAVFPGTLQIHLHGNRPVQAILPDQYDIICLGSRLKPAGLEDGTQGRHLAIEWDHARVLHLAADEHFQAGKRLDVKSHLRFLIFLSVTIGQPFAQFFHGQAGGFDVAQHQDSDSSVWSDGDFRVQIGNVQHLDRKLIALLQKVAAIFHSLRLGSHNRSGRIGSFAGEKLRRLRPGDHVTEAERTEDGNADRDTTPPRPGTMATRVAAVWICVHVYHGSVGYRLWNQLKSTIQPDHKSNCF